MYLSKLITILLIFGFKMNTAFCSDIYQWIFSLEENCQTTCQREIDFPYSISTYKNDTEVCAKKDLFGQRFIPGYKKLDEDKCFAKDLRNNIFQCLCSKFEDQLVWVDYVEKTRDCSYTCQQVGKTSITGQNTRLQVCSSIIHEKELSGYVTKENARQYCITGDFKSSIAQCLCN